MILYLFLFQNTSFRNQNNSEYFEIDSIWKCCGSCVCLILSDKRSIIRFKFNWISNLFCGSYSLTILRVLQFTLEDLHDYFWGRNRNCDLKMTFYRWKVALLVLCLSEKVFNILTTCLIFAPFSTQIYHSLNLAINENVKEVFLS